MTGIRAARLALGVACAMLVACTVWLGSSDAPPNAVHYALVALELICIAMVARSTALTAKVALCFTAMVLQVLGVLVTQFTPSHTWYNDAAREVPAAATVSLATLLTVLYVRDLRRSMHAAPLRQAELEGES